MVEYLSISFLVEKKYKASEDKEAVRLYKLEIPYGAPYEEIYVAVDEVMQRVKDLEAEGKRKEKEEAEKSEEVTAEVVNS